MSNKVPNEMSRKTRDEMIEVPWSERSALRERLPLIKVVGISAGGKSTLVKRLREAGYNSQPVSQEHSSIPDLWTQFEKPDILLYVDISLEEQRIRRPDVTWSEKNWQIEASRLSHARDHADLIINTTGSSPEEVFTIALTFLTHNNVQKSDDPLPPITATGSFRKNSRIPKE